MSNMAFDVRSNHKLLPRLYMVTPDPRNEPDFLDILMIHLEQGVQLIQIRAKTLTESEFEILARTIMAKAKDFQSQIVFNTSICMAQKLKMNGIHLTSTLLMSLDNRPFPQEVIISAACHNRVQLQHAETLGVNFVTLSPVLPTQTHPEAEPLGWEPFKQLCQTTTLPVFALGGMSKETLDMAMQCSAYGIAAIRSLW